MAQVYAAELAKVTPLPASPTSPASPVWSPSGSAAGCTAVPKDQSASREQIRSGMLALGREIEGLSHYLDPEISAICNKTAEALSVLKEQLAALRPLKAQLSQAPLWPGTVRLRRSAICARVLLLCRGSLL